MKHFKPLTIYGFTIFTNAAISFGTFSILSHYLSEVDYGIINLYNSFVVLLLPFINIGIPYMLNVDYFKMDEIGFRAQFSNALAILAGFTLVFTLSLVLLNGYVQKVVKVNFFFAITVAMSCFMLIVNDIFLNLLRNKSRYLTYAGFAFTKNLIEIGVTLLLVIGLGYAWPGRLAGNLIALSVITLIGLNFIRRWQLLNFRFDRKIIAAILIGGLPFIPERLAIFVMGYSDRFFIDHYSGTADVGYYGAGAQVALIVSLSISTLNTTFHPVLYQCLTLQAIDYKAVKKAVLTFVSISALIATGVILCSPLLFRFLIGPKFQLGQVYAFNLVVGLFFWSIYNVFVAFLFYLRKNNLIMRISLLGMLVSVIANFINVRRFGALGATYTSMLVYFSMAAVTIFFVHKYYNLSRIFRVGHAPSKKHGREIITK